MLARRLAAVLVVLGIVAASTVARADDFSYQEGARALSRVDDHATKGTIEIVGGALALGAGGALTTAGLWPCESGKDCSTRGLGAALGVPLAVGGAFLVLAGVRDRSNASTLRQALESDPSGVAAAQEAERIYDRGRAEMLAGALVTVAGLGGLTASLFLAKGCGSSCGAATAVGIGGGAVSLAGLSLVTLSLSDRSAGRIPLGAPIVPVASPSSIGIATSFAF